MNQTIVSGNGAESNRTVYIDRPNKRPYKRQTNEYKKELIADNIIDLESYNGHEFDRYYYDFVDDKLYLYTRGKYKLIKPSFDGIMHKVSLVDVNGNFHQCGYNKLMRELAATAKNMQQDTS